MNKKCTCIKYYAEGYGSKMEFGGMPQLFHLSKIHFWFHPPRGTRREAVRTPRPRTMGAKRRFTEWHAPHCRDRGRGDAPFRKGTYSAPGSLIGPSVFILVRVQQAMHFSIHPPGYSQAPHVPHADTAGENGNSQTHFAEIQNKHPESGPAYSSNERSTVGRLGSMHKAFRSKKDDAMALHRDSYESYIRSYIQSPSEELATRVLLATRERIKLCDPHQADQYMTSLKVLSIQPDIGTYNALIRVHAAEKNFDRVHAVIEEMKSTDTKPTNVTCTILMTAYRKADRLKEAIALFDEMNKLQIKLDAAVYNAMIAVHMKDKKPDMALDTIRKMKSSEDANARPDVFTYDTVIMPSVKDGKLNDALILFEEMIKDGVTPNESICSALISGLGKDLRVDEAVDVFRKAEEAGFKHNARTYNSLLAVYGKARMVNEARALVHDMQEAQVTPDYITYCTMISACVNAGKLSETKGILNEAVDKGVFKKNLGYDAGKNSLNLHVNSLYRQRVVSEHEYGVPSEVAIALFHYHWGQKPVKPATGFIVGRHGRDVLKNTMKKCIEKEHQMKAVIGTCPNGSPNEGMLVAQHAGTEQVSPFPTALNVHATPFIPLWKKMKQV